MNHDDVAAALKTILADIAPEADLDDLEDDTDIRDELDIDSMDYLNVIVAVKKRFEVEIPESDYPQLDTFGAMVAYIQARATP